MTLTDEELDRDWKPSGRRPQSTIARSFSQELQDIFRIENSVADLDEKVDQRKHQISTQSNELEALEARIREMEERLRRSQQAGLAGFYRPGNPPPAAPASNTQTSASASSSAPGLPVRSSHRREAAPPPPVPKDDAYTQAQAQQKARSRPGTARQVAPSSGAMPPTPVASEGEYELVDGDNSEEEEEEDEEESSEEEPPARSPRRRHA